MSEKEKKVKTKEKVFDPDAILDNVSEETLRRLEAAERAYEGKAGLPLDLDEHSRAMASRRLQDADEEIMARLLDKRQTTGHSSYVLDEKLAELNAILNKGDVTGFGSATVVQLQREINDGLLTLADFSNYPELLKRLHKK